MLVDLIHILADIEEFIMKCDSTFSCVGCVLQHNKELCETLLNLPDTIGSTIYGGNTKC